MQEHDSGVRGDRERLAMVAFRRAYAEADEAGRDRAECYQAAFAAYDAELWRLLSMPPSVQETDASSEAA